MTAAQGEVPPPAGERAFIARLRAMLPPPPTDQVWIGDDAAVLEGGLLLKTDVVVEGVHFDLAWCQPDDVGWKALAVNLSDIAAMGGAPTAAVVSLVVRAERAGEADQVMAGLATAAASLGCPIVGGDTSTGPALVVAVAVLGRTPHPGPVLRAGAGAGDLIVVTGELGGAGAALGRLQAGARQAPGQEQLHRPVPRLAEGAAAAAAGATAMIDLSDGLAADLQRLCDESGCAATIDRDAIPVAGAADLDTALFGGDDYELLFTIAADRLPALRSWALTPLTPIGVITAGPPGLTIRDADGAARPLRGPSFEHGIPAPAEQSP